MAQHSFTWCLNLVFKQKQKEKKQQKQKTPSRHIFEHPPAASLFDEMLQPSGAISEEAPGKLWPLGASPYTCPCVGASGVGLSQTAPPGAGGVVGASGFAGGSLGPATVLVTASLTLRTVAAGPPRAVSEIPWRIKSLPLLLQRLHVLRIVCVYHPEIQAGGRNAREGEETRDILIQSWKLSSSKTLRSSASVTWGPVADCISISQQIAPAGVK